MTAMLASRTPAAPDWVDELFGNAVREFFDTEDAQSAVAAYPVDAWEDDDHLYLEAELPGYRREDIQITLEQGLLQVTAQRQPREAQGRILRQERPVRYRRAFRLPTGVDDAAVQARYEDGVLRLTMPKRAEVKPRRIALK